MPLLNAWTLGVLLIAMLLSLPVIVIFSSVFMPASPVWQHLFETVLVEYCFNSAGLMLITGAAALLLGVGSAWLVAFCSFPGCSRFQWALTLPLAMPAYIIAYTYSAILDFAGPVQSRLRQWFAWEYGDYWFPEIHSLPGAGLMMALVLYPYIYLLARSAFLEQSVSLQEACRILGAGPWKGFLRVTLPMARPSIVAGLSLVLMETLADYGTVKYFGVTTFTTGIFRTWLGLGDSVAAAQLSALLLGVVLLLVWTENRARQKLRYYGMVDSGKPAKIHLVGWRAAVASMLCFIPLLFGFLLPAGQLGFWVWQTAAVTIDQGFWALAFNSFSLAVLTALLALLLAMFMAYGKRLLGNGAALIAIRMATMGYAVPGAVVAVGLMLPLGWFDNWLDGFLRQHFAISTGLLLSGTLFILMLAYLVRFLAVAINTCDAGLVAISPAMDDAARSLGRHPWNVLWCIHVPLMSRTLLACLLLVFVDVLKELPATLALRPFNFNTLAVRAFELATDERLADSASAALTIVLVGLLPVVYLNRMIGDNQEKRS